MEGDRAMAKAPQQQGKRLIPFIRVGRLKRALPRLIEQELAGEAGTATDTPWSMSIPDAGRRYFGLGRQMSYSVAYEVTSEN
jgi:hypothetical protein